ncbi:MAG: dockerin type I domain-containing protein [Clostridiales bacterium]|jgi:predicted acyl esterase|nr:dockerin type I domain-containing protein [Clostridiales bacterium]
MNKRLSIILVITLALVFSVSLAAFAEDTWDNARESNLAIFPNWIAIDSQGDLTTQPIFQYATANYINETVWVEVPCDTDRDGIRDRISVYIRRPNNAALNGFKCGAVMELSPYHFSTIGWSRVNTAAFNNSTDPHVKDLQSTARYHDNHPIIQPINPDTTNLTYDDIKYKGTEAWDPVWWQDTAFTVDSWYTDPVPASTVSTSVATVGATSPTNAISSYTQYFTRGYAMIYAQLLGASNCTGITSSLHVEEWICCAAVAQWLRGDVKAFTSRNGTVEVKASAWSNGNLAMTGTSYPGTTPLVTAMTGVPGIKAIMPEANVGSWYEYYRAGGAINSPGGYGGEDMNLHASYNFTRFNADASSGIPPAAGPNFNLAAQEEYVKTQKHMMTVQDRATGDYNAEWDVRNLTRGAAHINPDVGVLQTSGQMDWNVKPSNSVKTLQAMRDNFKGNHKYITSLSAHASQSGRLVPGKDGVSRGTTKWFLMFLDHHLYGIDNHVEDLMYDINIANFTTGAIEGFDYDQSIEERGTIMPGTHYQKIYLTEGPAGKAGRLSYVQPLPAVTQFRDMEIFEQLDEPAPQGTSTLSVNDRTIIPSSGDGNTRVNSTQANFCQDRYVGLNTTTTSYGTAGSLIANIDKPIKGRLMYLSEPLKERLTLSGTTVIHMLASPDNGTGNISAALFEIGRRSNRVGTGRTSTSMSTTGSTTVFAAVNGASVHTAARYAAPANASNYKWVTWGHTEVQNPSHDGKAWFEVPEQNYTPNFYFQTTKIEPGQYYPYLIEMEPYNYTFEAGTQIGIMIYGTDPNYSPLLSPECAANFDVKLGEGTYAMIPLKFAEPEEAIVIEVADVLAAPGGTVDVTYSIKGNDFGFSALDLKIPYDSAVYTPVGVTAASALAGPLFVFNPAYAADMMRVAFVAEENIFGNDILFTVKYQVAATAPGNGDLPLNLEPVKMQCYSLMDKLVDLDVTVNKGTLVMGILGDVDGNGFVTPEDAMMILQMLVGLIDWTPRALLLGDINGDGVVDTTDAALILRMVVGG